MKVKELTVGKTYNTGNYTSTRLDVTAAIEKGENIKKAKLNCEVMLDNLARMSSKEFLKARAILDNADDHTGKELKWAEEVIKSLQDDRIDSYEENATSAAINHLVIKGHLEVCICCKNKGLMMQFSDPGNGSVILESRGSNIIELLLNMVEEIKAGE